MHCSTCENKKKRKHLSNLSLYKSRKRKYNKFECGCCPDLKKPKLNFPVSHSDQLNTTKCTMYQKTCGKRHKLCIGQNKSHKRWRKLKNYEMHSGDIDIPISDSKSMLSTSETIIIPFQENKSSVLDRIPLRTNHNPISVDILDETYSKFKEKSSAKSKQSQNDIPDKDYSLSTSVQNSSSESVGTVISSEIEKKKRINKVVKKLRNPKMLEQLVMKLDEHN